MRTHLSSVAEENKLSDGSGNVGVCENPQAGASVGAVAGTSKKPVYVKAALNLKYTNTKYFPCKICVWSEDTSM